MLTSIRRVPSKRDLHIRILRVTQTQYANLMGEKGPLHFCISPYTSTPFEYYRWGHLSRYRQVRYLGLNRTNRARGRGQLVLKVNESKPTESRTTTAATETSNDQEDLTALLDMYQ